MKGICYIIGPCESGRTKLDIKNGDYVIAADGGYEMLDSYGVTCDILIGDLDSLGYTPSSCKVLRHPVRKDETDSFLAAKYAYELGYRVFVMLGCCGGQRPDHTAANISLLAWLALRGAYGYLVGDGFAYTALKDGEISFSPENHGNISVFSMSEISCGVWESGLSYTLDGASLCYDFPLGVSNSFMGKEAKIKVEKGMLLIYWQTDRDSLMRTVENRLLV